MLTNILHFKWVSRNLARDSMRLNKTKDLNQTSEGKEKQMYNKILTSSKPLNYED